MFFPERIVSIKEGDKVLEIGPGATPHPRSDVLLEKIFGDADEARQQRGNMPELQTSKKVVMYDGDRFPFSDEEFDYCICSHVLEHVDDVKGFVEEVFRVSKKGYFEYPTIYYDYLYNIKHHLNFLKYEAGCLYFMKKDLTALSSFISVQKLLFQSLNKGYTTLVDSLQPIMFQGFEWETRFTVKQAVSLDDLTCDYELPVYLPQKKRSGKFITFLKRAIFAKR